MELPTLFYDIIDLIASLLRLVGMAAFGVGFGWLALDLLRKSSAWQVQIAVFLGLAGLVIALVDFLAWGALGGFCIGLSVAIFVWGLPKKKKEKED